MRREHIRCALLQRGRRLVYKRGENFGKGEVRLTASPWGRLESRPQRLTGGRAWRHRLCGQGERGGSCVHMDACDGVGAASAVRGCVLLSSECCIASTLFAMTASGNCSGTTPSRVRAAMS